VLDLDLNLDLCLKIRSPGASLVAGRRSLGSPERKGKRKKRERKRVKSFIRTRRGSGVWGLYAVWNTLIT
jgi:hypothetical protein